MVSGNPLFDTGVLTTTGEEVTLSDQFEEIVESYLGTFTGYTTAKFAAEIRSRVDDSAVVEPLAALGSDDPRTVAELCALTEFLETSDEAIQLLAPLWLFRPGDVRTDGAPDPFIPVSAPELPQLLRIYSPALVYVWLDDSERCDLAKRDLEAVFEEPQNVMPFAVYGPAYKEFLEREYDLSAGPAILFTRDGEVEARLYGAHGAATIEAELARHRG